MRISDWSSDVCSADLAPARQPPLAAGAAGAVAAAPRRPDRLMATDRTARSPKGWARRDAITTTSWGTPPEHLPDPMADDVVLEMGWGRLIFGPTFSDPAGIEAALRDERLGRRELALSMRDPHTLLSPPPP